MGRRMRVGLVMLAVLLTSATTLSAAGPAWATAPAGESPTPASTTASTALSSANARGTARATPMPTPDFDFPRPSASDVGSPMPTSSNSPANPTALSSTFKLENRTDSLLRHYDNRSHPLDANWVLNPGTQGPYQDFVKWPTYNVWPNQYGSWEVTWWASAVAYDPHLVTYLLIPISGAPVEWVLFHGTGIHRDHENYSAYCEVLTNEGKKSSDYECTGYPTSQEFEVKSTRSVIDLQVAQPPPTSGAPTTPGSAPTIPNSPTTITPATAGAYFKNLCAGPAPAHCTYSPTGDSFPTANLPAQSSLTVTNCSSTPQDPDVLWSKKITQSSTLSVSLTASEQASLEGIFTAGLSESVGFSHTWFNATTFAQKIPVSAVAQQKVSAQVSYAVREVIGDIEIRNPTTTWYLRGVTFIDPGQTSDGGQVTSVDVTYESWDNTQPWFQQCPGHPSPIPPTPGATSSPATTSPLQSPKP